MINYPAIRALETLQESTTLVESVLINTEDQSKLFTFLWNPVNYNFSATSEYAVKYALFGKRPHIRFRNAQAGILTMNQLRFITPCGTKDLTPLKRSLNNLRYPLENKEFPPVLSWVTGQHQIQPLYLQTCTFDQTGQLDGRTIEMIVSLVFLAADRITF